MQKYASIEQLLVSLYVLSKTNANDKLFINHYGRVAIHKDNKLTALRRWVYGENRIKSLHYINTIINDTIDKISQFDHSTDSLEISYRNQLLDMLNQTIAGIENLKITYEDDIYTVSYLDSMISRIKLFKQSNGNQSLVACD